MLDPDTITVELHDGRCFRYVTNQLPSEVVDDLKAKGVRLADIKNTIQVISRAHPMLAKAMRED